MPAKSRLLLFPPSWLASVTAFIDSYHPTRKTCTHKHAHLRTPMHTHAHPSTPNNFFRFEESTAMEETELQGMAKRKKIGGQKADVVRQAPLCRLYARSSPRSSSDNARMTGKKNLLACPPVSPSPHGRRLLVRGLSTRWKKAACTQRVERQNRSCRRSRGETDGGEMVIRWSSGVYYDI